MIALIAPSDAEIEIADPDEGLNTEERRYEMCIRSPSDISPIEVIHVNPLKGSGVLKPPNETAPNGHISVLNGKVGLAEVFATSFK